MIARFRRDPFDVSDILGGDDDDDADVISQKIHAGNKAQNTKRSADSVTPSTVTSLSTSTNVSSGMQKYHVIVVGKYCSNK